MIDLIKNIFVIFLILLNIVLIVKLKNYKQKEMYT